MSDRQGPDPHPNMSACDRQLSDLTISDLGNILPFHHLPRNRTLLLISQLDHAQATAVTILQLMRCAATGSGGHLAVAHADDWPELRLINAASTTPPISPSSPLSTLPPRVCSTSTAWKSSEWSRFLDFRCHAPGGSLGRAYPRRLTSCLVELSNGESRALGMAHALGATDGMRRAALARSARRLLEMGTEAEIERRQPGALRHPACCTVSPCESKPSPSWIRRAASPSPPLPPPPPPDADPRHPRPLGLLEPPPPGTHATSPTRDAGASASLYASHGAADGLAEAASRSNTRPPEALVAKAASRLLADGAGLLPTAFDRRFANPCWRCDTNATKSTRAQSARADGLCCLPYAHILGVSKCGTTDLHNRLAAHPHVLPAANKGPHFWDSPHTFEWYVGLYAASARRLDDGRAHPGSVLLDASSNTLTYTGIGVRDVLHPSPPVTLPHVMRWLQPSVRLLLMLREPAARYYSAYTYYNRRYRVYKRFGRLGAEAFGEMVLSDIGAFSRCRQGATARRCARTIYHEAEQLVKGLYALFLEGWLDAFPREQLLVIRLDDYEAALERHLELVMAFLNLPQPPRRTWRRMLDKPRANRQARGVPMLESTRDVLRVFYAEHNEHLAELMGDPRYLEWNEDRTAAGGGGEPRAGPEPSVWGAVG